MLILPLLVFFSLQSTGHAEKMPMPKLKTVQATEQQTEKDAWLSDDSKTSLFFGIMIASTFLGFFYLGACIQWILFRYDSPSLRISFLERFGRPPHSIVASMLCFGVANLASELLNQVKNEPCSTSNA